MKTFIIRIVSLLLFFATLWVEPGRDVFQSNQNLPLHGAIVSSSVEEQVGLGSDIIGITIDLIIVARRQEKEEKKTLISVFSSIKQSIDLDKKSLRLFKDRNSSTSCKNQYINSLVGRYTDGYYLYSLNKLLI